MSEDIRTRQGRRKQKESEKKKNSSPKKLVLKKIGLSLAVFFGVLLIAGSITIFSMIKDAPPLDPEKLTLAQNPAILDQNDELFTTLTAVENRRLATIDEIPPLLENAFISVEDIRFREHFGLDLRRIGGAVRANVTGGFGAEGASTITQQVVKNLYLSSEKRITRKIQEQYLAIKLEQKYSKDQILEMYLNAIYFSEGAYGVVEAAERYFSKTLEELEVQDVALLAGIPQRPNFFNPFNNPEEAEKRRNVVISLMERYGKISSEQATKAREIRVEDQLKRSEKEPYPYRAFLDQVLKEVEAIDGITSTDIYTGGLTIYTTIDQDAQRFVDNLLQSEDQINFPDEFFQAGLTVVDTKTGEIKAIGGGRQKEVVKRGYNWATDPKRQPGSTIKPVLDYGPAIEHLKWSTYHQIKDEPHQYTNGVPIRNFNNQYAGNVSMRHALLRSLNIPAVKAFQAVGKETAAEFGKGLGIPLDTIEEPYSLGGFTTGISTLELAGAYSAFGNEGVYNKPHTVRKVVFPDGRTIDLTPKSHMAMSDYTAFMITDMLKSAVAPSGTGVRARVDSLPMAGKTGTSNFSEQEKQRFNITSGAKDIWFAGYTTNYSIAVWTGYNTPEEGYIKYDGHSEHIAKDLFKKVMTEISKGKETPDFKQPDSVVRVGLERATGLLPSAHTPRDQIIYEYFVKGTEPSKVSERFAKPVAPSDFMGTYQEDTDQIILSWVYPSEDRAKHKFELEVSINGGSFSLISSTNDMQHIIKNPNADSTYKFRLSAVSKDNNQLRSDRIEITVTTPKKEIEEVVEETPPPIEIPDPVEDLEVEDDVQEDNEKPEEENNSEQTEEIVEQQSEDTNGT